MVSIEELSKEEEKLKELLEKEKQRSEKEIEEAKAKAKEIITETENEANLLKDRLIEESRKKGEEEGKKEAKKYIDLANKIKVLDKEEIRRIVEKYLFENDKT
ncbi:MAG: hypothetical protein QW061_01420 [Candidatus Rehaiarchaeum fermentans]|nr:hypothetical protein [Candidatus Rehaiarchaeum fermentans]MCW1297310.1 hypothetical protein [Candidatus Rehaiarchaeum fermentans]